MSFTSPTDAKVLQVCKTLCEPPTKLTPKQFILHFLTSPNSDLCFLQRFWGQPTGIESTMEIIQQLGSLLKCTSAGKQVWKDFIKSQAGEILREENPPRGLYPEGSFQSSKAVTAQFFSTDERENHDRRMVTWMPFLHGILMAMSPGANPESNLEDDLPLGRVDNESSAMTGDLLEEVGVAEGLGQYGPPVDDYTSKRFERIVLTVCSIMAFAVNRRANALQMNNSVRILACGVSERVHEYLNHIGLSASQWSAISAMRSLAKEAQHNLKDAMKLDPSCPIVPTICIDNIDMEEKVHNISVGNRSNTLRGTWGYVHVPNPQLVSMLNKCELTLESFREAVDTFKSVTIEPTSFLPTSDEAQIEACLWKSQIARVLHQYLAAPKDGSTAIPLDPPVVEQIQANKPVIHMLKLMDASDNSAEGVGQVFQMIIQQSGLSIDDFFGRVQPMDGDLGTLQNFNCLRSQRLPSSYPQDQLNNVIFQLGASHTLWNIGLAIFSHHFGKISDPKNCGAWQYLQALGFPPEKAIQKKDFSLMVNQMEKIFESMLYYCLHVVMKTSRTTIGEERSVIATDKWNDIVNETYEMFCTPQARKAADMRESPKLHNMLIQLHDFSLVVEAKRSMKSGDVGRLMIVWKKWCIMTQSIKKVTNYSTYLPRMVLLLSGHLKPSLSKYLRHNLLITPTGRPNHFVAKDFWLEIQNYWLKYMYNKSGIGTQIERLRELFSPNILMLQQLFHTLKLDCGSKIIYQTHHNLLSTRSLEMMMLMGNNRDILDQLALGDGNKIEKLANTYLDGIAKFKKIIRHKDHTLSKFKKHLGTKIIVNPLANESDSDGSGEEYNSEDM